ncbi:HEAT repeat domain-containing protein [Paenibacillus sp. JSM ZJ436]|uniref:HEAT repeat domain-containing protein n=1 Tax=Paenibacillus sp. JSM ZJ436 TaxID=3376190 RepID=UPI003788B064
MREAFILLWISSGLVMVFFIAIVLMWMSAHHRMKKEQQLSAVFEQELNELLNGKVRESRIRTGEWSRLLRGKAFRYELLISCLARRGEDELYKHQELLYTFYDKVGIIDFLERRLHSNQEHLQALACQYIGDLRLKSFGDEMSRLSSSKSNHVVYHVLLALAKLGDLERLSGTLVKQSSTLSLSFRTLLEVLSEFKGSKRDLFKLTLDQSDDYLKSILIKSAADEQLEGLEEYYLEHLNSSNINLRIACIRALGGWKDSSIEPELVRQLEDPAWEVRAAAAKSLEGTRTRASLQALVQATGDSEWWVRHNAAKTLAASPDGEEYVQRIINGEDQFAREAVIGVMEISV